MAAINLNSWNGGNNWVKSKLVQQKQMDHLMRLTGNFSNPIGLYKEPIREQSLLDLKMSRGSPFSSQLWNNLRKMFQHKITLKIKSSTMHVKIKKIN